MIKNKPTPRLPHSIQSANDTYRQIGGSLQLPFPCPLSSIFLNSSLFYCIQECVRAERGHCWRCSPSTPGSRWRPRRFTSSTTRPTTGTGSEAPRKGLHRIYQISSWGTSKRYSYVGQLLWKGPATGTGSEALQKGLLMEVFFDNGTKYRYMIKGASKRPSYGGPLLRQRDQLQVEDQRHLKKVFL